MKFSFGENWLSYSKHALDNNKVEAARAAFRSLTSGIDLRGARFLDIGFGQGLALFLASELGAEVHGVDADPVCGEALEATNRYFPSLPKPEITIGSILDDAVVQKCKASNPYAVVHSWGVLHHTGKMKTAFRNVAALVKPGGFLIVSIYNRHWTSPLWRAIKHAFNRMPRFLQETLILALYPVFYSRARALSRGEGAVAMRGMDVRHDLRDWLGGYPYEYASATEVEDAFAALGFKTIRCQPTRGFTGCNEFVFQKAGDIPT